MNNLKQTPIFPIHKELKGKIVPFAGFEMPVQYPLGIVKEHLQVRNNIGIFDVSHMGEIFIQGPQAQQQADHLFSNNVSKLSVNKAAYGVLCNENGGIVDDVIAYKLSEENILFCVNAANIEKDFEHMKNNLSFDCNIENKSDDWSQIAVQGPNASKLITKILGVELPESPFEVLQKDRLILATTGYTGEKGCEIFVPNAEAASLFSNLLEDEFDAKPIGLGARDTLRMEKRYPLYGHELTDETSPLTVNLKWCLDMNKDFIGKEAILKRKEEEKKSRLICFVATGPGLPRENCKVFCNGEEVGLTSSGGFSPCLKKGIAIARLEVPWGKPGADQTIEIEVRGRRLPVESVKSPFV